MQPQDRIQPYHKLMKPIEDSRSAAAELALFERPLREWFNAVFPGPIEARKQGVDARSGFWCSQYQPLESPSPRFAL
jgi:hypothetical protein